MLLYFVQYTNNVIYGYSSVAPLNIHFYNALCALVIGIRIHVKRLEYIPTELVENVQWSCHRVHRVAMATFWHTFHSRG